MLSEPEKLIIIQAFTMKVWPSDLADIYAAGFDFIKLDQEVIHGRNLYTEDNSSITPMPSGTCLIHHVDGSISGVDGDETFIHFF